MAIKQEKPFMGFDHGTNRIVVPPFVMGVLLPIQVHIKQDGSIKDEPSLAFINVDHHGIGYVSEISVEMFNEGLADIGYKLVKI